MATLADMPRRLTRDDEDLLLNTASRLNSAREDVTACRAELDRVIMELRRSGARAADMADVLQLSIKSINDAIRRAEHETDDGSDAA